MLLDSIATFLNENMTIFCRCHGSSAGPTSSLCSELQRVKKINQNVFTNRKQHKDKETINLK